MKKNNRKDRLRGANAAGAGQRQGEKVKRENWVPSDFVRISKIYKNVPEQIEAWKSFCLARGRAMGFDLDISKLEKTVNDEFLGLEISPIPEIAVLKWPYLAEKVMKGDRAFCSAHEIKRVKVTPGKNYTKEEAAAYLGVSVKRIGQLLEEEKLVKLKKTRGNKALIQGRIILEYKAKQKK